MRTKFRPKANGVPLHVDYIRGTSSKHELVATALHGNTLPSRRPLLPPPPAPITSPPIFMGGSRRQRPDPPTYRARLDHRPIPRSPSPDARDRPNSPEGRTSPPTAEARPPPPLPPTAPPTRPPPPPEPSAPVLPPAMSTAATLSGSSVNRRLLMARRPLRQPFQTLTVVSLQIPGSGTTTADTTPISSAPSSPTAPPPARRDDSPLEEGEIISQAMEVDPQTTSPPTASRPAAPALTTSGTATAGPEPIPGPSTATPGTSTAATAAPAAPPAAPSDGTAADDAVRALVGQLSAIGPFNPRPDQAPMAALGEFFSRAFVAALTAIQPRPAAPSPAPTPPARPPTDRNVPRAHAATQAPPPILPQAPAASVATQTAAPQQGTAPADPADQPLPPDSPHPQRQD